MQFLTMPSTQFFLLQLFRFFDNTFKLVRFHTGNFIFAALHLMLGKRKSQIPILDHHSLYFPPHYPPTDSPSHHSPRGIAISTVRIFFIPSLHIRPGLFSLSIFKLLTPPPNFRSYLPFLSSLPSFHPTLYPAMFPLGSTTVITSAANRTLSRTHFPRLS